MIPVTSGVPRVAPVCDPWFGRGRPGGEVRAGRSPTPNLRGRTAHVGPNAVDTL